MLNETKKSYRGLTAVTVICGIICAGLGTLSHFVYDLAGRSFASALISGVNESTWEHLKLLFIPFFFMTVIEYFIYGRKYSAFFSSRLLGVLLGMTAIAVMYYTYTGIVGKDFPVINIAIFLAAVFIAYAFSYFRIIIFGEGDTPAKSEIPAVFAFVLITALFFAFTFNAPKIGLFRDPVTGNYGI